MCGGSETVVGQLDVTDYALRSPELLNKGNKDSVKWEYS